MNNPSRAETLEWLGAIWSRRKWLAVAIFTVTATTGAAIVLGLPSIYRSTATLLVEQPKIDAPAPGELENRLQTIHQEVLSRARLQRLIAGFDLYPGLRRHGTTEAVIGQMRRDIRTEYRTPLQAMGPGSIVAFTLSYRGPRPDVVAGVANALASLYVEQDERIREQRTSGAVELLKNQLEDVRRELQQQERALAEFQDAHSGELPQQADLNLATMTRLHEELRTIHEQRARALERRDDLQRRLAEAEASGPATGASDAAARLAKAKAELDELRQRFSEKYPDVIRLRSEVARLEREAARDQPRPVADTAPSRTVLQIKDSLADLVTEIENFKADETRVRAEIATYLQRLENAPRRQRRAQEISRDYQTTRDLYDSLRKRYDQALLEQGAEGSAAPRFRILDPAMAPSEPVAPNRPVLLVLVVLAALTVAMGAVALSDRLDTSFHTADDVRAFTRVPVLASIPRIVTEGDLLRRRRWFWAAAAAVVLAQALLVPTLHSFARSQDALVSMLARP